MQKTFFLFFILYSTVLFSQKKDLELEKFLLSIPIIDGVAGYGSEKSKKDNTIGYPNFNTDSQGKSVLKRTFINICSINITTDERLLDRTTQFINKRCKGGVIIKNENDIDRCLKSGEFGMIYYSQKHFVLNGDVSNIDRWYQKGLRILQLHYGKNDKLNLLKSERLGHSGYEIEGLTKLGIKAVNKSIDINMILDLSHCNEATILETCEIAKKRGVPVLGNHMAAIKARDIYSKKKSTQVMCNYPRLWTDKAIKAVADTGGVVGVMLYPGWISCESSYKSSYTKSGTIEQVASHIDHIVKLVGVDHVGIGSDGYLDGTPAYDTYGDNKIDSPERMYYIAKFLLKKGYSKDDISKILGGNFLRVYRQIL